MDLNMKDIMLRERNMDKDPTLGLISLNMWETGKIIK